VDPGQANFYSIGSNIYNDVSKQKTLNLF